MGKSIIIFGLGYVAEFVATEMSRLGWTVYVTSRVRNTSNRHYSVINFSDHRLFSLLNSSHAILSTVPPCEDSVDPVLEKYIDIIMNGNFEWVGYLSSTSVYGDHGGKWVDETSQCLPCNDRAKLILLAEKKWLSMYEETDFKLPVHIMRLSGIYGPRRNCLEHIRNGKDFTIVKNGQFFSRIHVEDICKAVSYSISSPTPGEIYNVSDNEPAPLCLVQQYGASILNLPKLREIKFEDADISDDMKRFFLSNKKISSSKISNNLGVKWQYPNYRVGLLKGCLPYLTNQSKT